ncbi:hypothetical protein ACHAXN_000950 [Cyclotella atomus]
MKLVLPPNWAQPFAASGAAVPPDAGVKAKDFMLIVFALFGKADRLSFSECFEGDVKKRLMKLATRHGLGTIWMVLSDIPYFQDIVKLPEFQEFNDPESSKFRSLTRNPCWTTVKKETARTIRVEWLEPNKEFPWIYGLLTTLNKEGLQGVLRGSVSASDAEQAAALLRPNTPAQIHTTRPRPRHRPPRPIAARASAPPSFGTILETEDMSVDLPRTRAAAQDQHAENMSISTMEMEGLTSAAPQVLHTQPGFTLDALTDAVGSLSVQDNGFRLGVIINELKDKLKICEEMRDKAIRAYHGIDKTMKNADGSVSTQAEEYRTVLDQHFSDFVRAAADKAHGDVQFRMDIQFRMANQGFNKICEDIQKIGETITVPTRSGGSVVSEVTMQDADDTKENHFSFNFDRSQAKTPRRRNGGRSFKN